VGGQVRDRRGGTRRDWTTVGIVVAGVAIAVATISAIYRPADHTPSVGSADHELTAAYLAPLRDQGLPVTVVEACHYGTRVPNEPWHLDVEVRIGAGRNRVADVLAPTVEWIKRDREKWILQQNRADPQAGWNGSLSEDGAESRLRLVRNNVDPDPGESVAWQRVCPFLP
jgi:hypothetical protein